MVWSRHLPRIPSNGETGLKQGFGFNLKYLAMISMDEANGWYGGTLLGDLDENSEIYKHYAHPLIFKEKPSISQKLLSATGRINDEQRIDMIRNACPGAGACGGMYTTNTMASTIETMGMTPPFTYVRVPLSMLQPSV